MSYFIDVQGTLIDDVDKKPIEGAIAFIDTLNAKKIPYVVVTNNTKIPSTQFHQFLNDLGFSIPAQNYLDPFMALGNVLHVKNISLQSFITRRSCERMGLHVNDEVTLLIKASELFVLEVCDV